MDTNSIIVAIDEQIERLKRVKALLAADDIPKRRPGRPQKGTAPVAANSTGRRVMSAEARAKIGAAQRARWAKAKKAAR